MKNKDLKQYICVLAMNINSVSLLDKDLNLDLENLSEKEFSENFSIQVHDCAHNSFINDFGDFAEDLSKLSHEDIIDVFDSLKSFVAIHNTYENAAEQLKLYINNDLDLENDLII